VNRPAWAILIIALLVPFGAARPQPADGDKPAAAKASKRSPVGKIHQKCNDSEINYFSTPDGAEFNGTVFVTNSGACDLVAYAWCSLTYEHGKPVVNECQDIKIAPGQTKSLTIRAMKFLRIICKSCDTEQSCDGTYQLWRGP
jgi:hypothetical protein